ncbi:UbiA family prenyltransferase [Candidatus Bathyarchaeota archaeon]|nr:UbiA family prenyltransferase [Candidatus Bathyarchaeota archaeon]
MSKSWSCKTRLLGFLSLIRPINCLMMGFAVIVGVILAGGCEVSAVNLTLGFLTAFAFTGASMAFNDFCDREIDRVNMPDRPIPKGVISPREALLLSVVLTIVGFASALLTNLNCFLLTLVACVLFVLYSTKGKRTGLIGNMMVSACVCIPFIYGGFISSGNFEAVTLIFSGMAFLANTGREVTKGIADIAGDRLRGVRTVAVTYGPRKAAFVAVTFYFAAVSMSLIPQLRNLLSIWHLPLLILADAGFAYSSLSLLFNPSKDNVLKVKSQVLMWMLLGLISFLLGAILL